MIFFFFKHKTAYEMRISDWSSDVCSSDLFDVTVVDDVPDAFDNTACLDEVAGVPQNVTLVVDVSASISGSEFGDMTAGLRALIAEYAALNVPVTFTLIPFANGVGAGVDFSFSGAGDAGYQDLYDELGELGQGYNGVDSFGTNYDAALNAAMDDLRSEEHTSELQSLMRISYAVFCLKKKKSKHIQP